MMQKTKVVVFVVLLLFLTGGYVFDFIVVLTDIKWQPYFNVEVQPSFDDFEFDSILTNYSNVTVGCKIRVLNPFDPQLTKLIRHPREVVCKQLQPFMSYIHDNNNLVLNETEFIQLQLLNPVDYVCTYAPFDRGTTTSDNSYSTYRYEAINVGETKVITTDQVFVNCTYNNFTETYMNIHALVPDRKVQLRQRDTQLSVLLLTIDSLSASMMDRSLPSTERFLRSTMKYQRFRGNTRVGINSMPNMGPVLTGLRYSNTSEEMQNELTSVEDKTFDHWPLIWKNFSAKGYVTAYVEDEPQYSIFNYLTRGFKTPPTDHYYRPWQLAMRSSKLSKNSSSYCFANDPKPFLLYDLLERVITKYKDNPYFLLAINNQPSHDSQTDLERLDDYIMNFLRRQHQLHRLNHTVVMIYGDHGPRWGSIRSTLVGRVEENLPFHSMWFPPWFYRKFPHILRSLKLNEMTLTTAFDAHQTLIDISQENFSCKLNKKNDRQSIRGRSQICPLPTYRTCSDAGVPNFHCVCESTNPRNLSNESIKVAAKAIMSTIDSSLENYRNVCAPLKLKSVLRVEMLSLKTNSVPDMFHIATVSFATTPCGGEFEVSFNVNDNSSYPLELDQIPMSQFVRTNMYGKQSGCVDVLQQKYFCCCFSYLNSTAYVKD